MKYRAAPAGAVALRCAREYSDRTARAAQSATTIPVPFDRNIGYLASFCVWAHEYESIVEMLRECTGSSPPGS